MENATEPSGASPGSQIANGEAELEASHKREMKLMVDLARASDIIRALESELATVREELEQTQTLLASQLEKTDPLGNGLF